MAINNPVKRISKSASLLVMSSIEKVYPLFGPIREKDWAAGWEPVILYSNHEEAEEHMMFKTPGDLPNEDFLWAITQFRPDEFMIEYTVSAHERIWFITVKCQVDDENTRVSVTYTYTGFTEKANELNQQALTKMFASNLKDWEEAINFYIKTGQQRI